jgi:penicillin-binding protein activator
VVYPAAPQAASAPAGGGEVAQAPSLESTYLATLADNLAGSIAALPRIANAKSTPRIVLDPVVNNTRVELDGGLFVRRVRVMLNQRAMNRVRFLDRDMLAAMQRDAQADFRGADYVLAGRFDPFAGAAQVSPGGTVLCGFRLSDARTGSVVWEGSYSMSGDNMASLLATVL